MMISKRSLIKLLLLDPLFLEKRRIIWLVIALVSLSLSQSAFLFLVGPLLQTFFKLNTSTISLKEIVPTQVLSYFPGLVELQVKTAVVSFALPLALVVIGFIKALSSYLYQFQQSALTLIIAKNYRNRLFEALLKRTYLDLAKTSAARWMSIIINDVMILQSRFSDLLTGLLKDGVLIISCIAILFFIHWPSALILLLMTPFLTYFLGRSSRKISAYAHNWQKRLADMNSLILSMRQRFNFIRAQQGEKRELEVFEESNLSYYQMIKKSLVLRSSFAPGLELLGLAALAGIIYAINSGIIADENLKGVVLLQFFAAIGLIIRPLRSLGEQVSRLQETKGSLRESVNSFLMLVSSEQAHIKKPSNIQLAYPAISIQQLKIHYTDQLAFSLKATIQWKKGEAIAIVGPSGAGKSSLIKVFAGLIDASRYEGNPSIDELRSHSAYVSQQVFLFEGSLRENLCYPATDNYPDEAIWKALEFVDLKEYFLDKAKNLDLRINFLNSNLSGGQLQRLTIARALLRNKDFLLLDEATSAFDLKTEAKFLAKLFEYIKINEKILIYVTHRLNHILDFDQVCFVENSELKLIGTHMQLIENPRYKQFVSST